MDEGSSPPLSRSEKYSGAVRLLLISVGLISIWLVIAYIAHSWAH